MKSIKRNFITDENNNVIDTYPFTLVKDTLITSPFRESTLELALSYLAEGMGPGGPLGPRPSTVYSLRTILG